MANPVPTIKELEAYKKFLDHHLKRFPEGGIVPTLNQWKQRKGLATRKTNKKKA
tara:strand:+ start:388 stop:549 length:162 start_codon:yes stop_codon:yes gene_type:complete